MYANSELTFVFISRYIKIASENQAQKIHILKLIKEILIFMYISLI